MSHERQQKAFSPYIAQGNAACLVCQDKALQLIHLGACGHAVCRGCMATHLLHALKLQHMPLVCPLPTCRCRLALQPALQLLEQQMPGSSSIAAKVLFGASDLALIPDHLCFACPYSDCQMPLELDVQLPDMPSDCPSCNRPVCGTCRSKWHSGLRCTQYQALVGRGRTAAPRSNFSMQQPHLITAAPLTCATGTI
eukprot:GHRR01024019.1.p1 GENE.GHRR01024019.1~~GHRR01024019.1.p1  ORF type:complete len:196 (+),score=64.96 GHRR01024019.1:597-1184(+)